MRNWWKKLCIFHDWSKWEPKSEPWFRVSPFIDGGEKVRYTQLLQFRTCSKCGKLQREKIN